MIEMAEKPRLFWFGKEVQAKEAFHSFSNVMCKTNPMLPELMSTEIFIAIILEHHCANVAELYESLQSAIATQKRGIIITDYALPSLLTSLDVEVIYTKDVEQTLAEVIGSYAFPFGN